MISRLAKPQKNSASGLLRQLRSKPESFWLKRGEKMAINLFKEMSVRVPAYKDFLKKNSVDPKTVKTISDLKKVPWVDKNNYLRAYPLADLCWDGKFSSKRWTISSTSGSTGEPFYFPREKEQDHQYALTAEMYLLSNFSIDKKTTLYIDGFPLGPWIGGIFTYEAIRIVAESGKYPLSIYTAGINKKEIIKAVKKFGKSFDQIIIGSYGPFLKDTLDDGILQGINWSDYNLRFIFSAEGFSEKFRDYVLDVSGLKDPYATTLNHYGTVDLGTMSHETPVAIMTRRIAIDNNDIFSSVFKGVAKLPTLTQYLPEMFYFEEEAGSIYCSARSGLPLVRYNLKDNGGVFTLEELGKMFKKNGLDLSEEIKKRDLEKYSWNLPFVYVYERGDFSISLYAFQIYPETVRRALESADLRSLVTGKFTMNVVYNEKMNQQFELNVELKHGIEDKNEIRQLIKQKVTDALLWENSEFRKTHETVGSGIEPVVKLWKYEDETYFKIGTKQQWVKK